MKSKIFFVVLLLYCSIAFGQAKDSTAIIDSTQFKLAVDGFNQANKMIRYADSLKIYWMGIRDDRYTRALNEERKLRNKKDDTNTVRPR